MVRGRKTAGEGVLDDDHTVIGRVFSILDAVTALGDRATLGALTRSTAIPKPTVRRIAGQLVERGVLDRSGNVYRLGSRLLEFGALAGEQRGYRPATAYLQDLHARSGEIAFLMVSTETTNAIVDSVFGANRLADVRRPWPSLIRDPVFLASASGRIVLADRPALVDDLRGRSLGRATTRTVTHWRAMEAVLATIRDTGIAVEHEEATLGFSCVAAAVRDSSGRVVAAVGVTGRTPTLRPQLLSRPLLAAADAIGRTMV
ncbi:IclR family transcriptional regulator [Dactylosporangium darangshiense]|uniref:IclR family transcriptional regulator n=1 Tax=Dactylosporangium darangshiense TaxID=579108 RepID=A0ABP8DPK7_9ACTN